MHLQIYTFSCLFMFKSQYPNILQNHIYPPSTLKRIIVPNDNQPKRDRKKKVLPDKSVIGHPWVVLSIEEDIMEVGEHVGFKTCDTSS